MSTVLSRRSLGTCHLKTSKALPIIVKMTCGVVQAQSLSALLLQKLARELRELHQRPEEGIRVRTVAGSDLR